MINTKKNPCPITGASLVSRFYFILVTRFKHQPALTNFRVHRGSRPGRATKSALRLHIKSTNLLVSRSSLPLLIPSAQLHSFSLPCFAIDAFCTNHLTHHPFSAKQRLRIRVQDRKQRSIPANE